MEKYDVISVVGEGSYGLVMRCRHRESGQYVAIKKFLETEDDPTVRKMALREIRMLKKLRHENLVNMLEVFRRKKRFFLVFEYLEHTVLEQLEACVGGLGFTVARKYCYQVLRALDFIHSHDVIHRDIKPENVLVSRLGIIKLCDFGFARPYAENETFTDYVATRWYRSPELLVGDPRYGKEVDIWAVGCLYAEMMTGEPLFPGESDIDQLFQIIRVVGKLNARHQLLVTRNTMFKGMKQEQNTSLHQMFPDWTHDSLDFLQLCLKMDGQQQRPDTGQLLVHDLFTGDGFHETFVRELREKLQQEMQGTPLLKRMPSYGSGRKAVPSQPGQAKKSGGSETKKSGGTGQQISLALNAGNSKPNSSAQRRMSTTTAAPVNGGEEIGLNLAALRTYLHQQHQKPQKSVVNINNLIFKEAIPMANGRVRILSAKPIRANESTAAATTATAKHDSSAPQPPSPIHYGSLQPDSLLSIGDPAHMKRLSPVSVSNLSVSGTAPPPQYFTHRRSSNILGLQQVAAQKSQSQKHNAFQSHGHSLNQQHPQVHKKRDRLIDVALMPLGSTVADQPADGASPRLLPPPWLTGNLKITTTQPDAKNVHQQIGKRGMTDWKSTTTANNNKPTSTAHSTPQQHPEMGGFLADLMLPTCPGATGLSPYKPAVRVANKLKLSPIAVADRPDDPTDGRK